MSDHLGVYIDDRQAGVLRADLTFLYSEAWLSWGGSYALSHSLPLREEPYAEPASRFFGNLLPEGAAREAVGRRLGISADNDYAFLRALGRDCAGSFVISDQPPDDAGSPPGYRLLSVEELARFEAEGSWLAAAVGSDVRLSLAGAQDKLPVLVRDDELHLPLHSAPSNALLKPAHKTYARLPENELLLGRLAAAIGLKTAAARPWPLPNATGLLVHRYDRIDQGDGTERLHQEDLCQALGFARHTKYEKEGGPTFAQCYRLVREVSTRALDDTRALLRWLVFCAITGNRDNHAKNLSIVRNDGWRLAPFYDLVCTRVFREINSELAMTIGGRTAAGELCRQAWIDEAARLEIGGSFFLGVVEDTANRLEEELTSVQENTALEVDGDALHGVVRVIKKGLRTIRRSLD